MFALPWYLTWFGHSLNAYSAVVRLYDYFLCAPPLFPVYVTAAIVAQRAPELLAAECDMAVLHCLLSWTNKARAACRSQVGTMFALPWYLTWFGHSLNAYSAVVRLYDYFLCAPPLFPVYVTAAIVAQRAPELLAAECDMAVLHCLLSRVSGEVSVYKQKSQ
ncbi:unnamed protein product [Plutella xylostella]|uniref:(diamondback moth) hypothetical protein n=1 Tax=Plutella xylostella TaxID=51655 RepID=A0A8S4DI83_PLUXY|nr:unnamed protein product [Plutella xylostella]